MSTCPESCYSRIINCSMPKSCAFSSLSIYLLISVSFCVNSQSHIVVKIIVKIFESSADGHQEFHKTGTLTFVDLAGTKLTSVGDSGADENQTDCCLSMFDRVLTALSEKDPHVPYRYVEQGCPIASVLLVNVV